MRAPEVPSPWPFSVGHGRCRAESENDNTEPIQRFPETREPPELSHIKMRNSAQAGRIKRNIQTSGYRSHTASRVTSTSSPGMRRAITSSTVTMTAFSQSGTS